MNHLIDYIKYYDKYYNNLLKSRYNLSPDYKIIYDKIEEDAPATTTIGDNDYVIIYDCDKITEKFSDHVKLIVAHELCHIYNSLLGYGDANGGHDEEFFIMLASLPGLNNDDLVLTKTRHIIPWVDNLDLSKIPPKIINSTPKSIPINRNFSQEDEIVYYFIYTTGECILCNKYGEQVGIIDERDREDIQEAKEKYELMPGYLVGRFYGKNLKGYNIRRRKD